LFGLAGGGHHALIRVLFGFLADASGADTTTSGLPDTGAKQIFQGANFIIIGIENAVAGIFYSFLERGCHFC
jgi:hypothetical protein